MIQQNEMCWRIGMTISGPRAAEAIPKALRVQQALAPSLNRSQGEAVLAAVIGRMDASTGAYSHVCRKQRLVMRRKLTLGFKVGFWRECSASGSFARLAARIAATPPAIAIR